MTGSDSCSPVTAPCLVPSKRENVAALGSRVTELGESRAELFNKIQVLKQDLQTWSSSLEGRVKTYRDEISQLKKSLNIELEQLRYDFQELNHTLHQRQEDVLTSLRNLEGKEDSVD